MERIFLDREYDPSARVHESALDRLRRRSTASGRSTLIIDCGANIGLSSIWFTERYPDATIIAIEPEPRNFAVLKRNAANFPNIIPVNAAISDRPSRITLSNSSDAPWAWQTQESTSGEIEALSIGSVIEGHKDHALMVVKVDIEGFETNLFRSDTSWVDNVPLIVFEIHDWMVPWSGSGHAFFSVLCRTKRDYVIKGENMFSYSDALRRELVPANSPAARAATTSERQPWPASIS
jgi:FkbM family methyltransferase